MIDSLIFSKIFTLIIFIITIFLILLMYRKMLKMKMGYENPLFSVIYALIMTCLLQTIAIIIDSDKRIDTIFITTYINDMSMTAVFVIAILLVFSSTIFLFLAKLDFNKQQRVARKFIFTLRKRRIIIIIVFLISIISISLLVFSSKIGVNIIDLISNPSKRIFLTASGKIQSFGYLRVLANSAIPLVLILIGHIIWMDIKLKFLNKLLLGFLIIFSLSPSIILSNRGAIFFVAIVIFLMLLNKNKLKLKKMILPFLIIFIIFSISSAYRHNISLLDNPLIGLNGIMYYGGGSSIFNNTVIASKLLYSNTENNYLMGATYIGAFVFFIPRFIWHDKPLISPDQYVADKIYQIHSNGIQAIPPGFVAELIMNFGLFGAFFFAIIFGILISTIYYLIKNYTNTFLSFLITNIIITKFMTKLIGTSFGFAVMDSIMLLIQILIYYKLIFEKKEKKS